MFVFTVTHPFVCECHNIATIPSAWTIPGLPGSQTLLPHRVARTHLGTMDWNPCAFAIIVLARPLSIFGRPVHPWDCSLDYDPVVLLKPFRLHLAVDALPSDALLHRPVRHYPHVWISTRGLGSSGTLTHLKRLLPGTHYGPFRLPPRPTPTRCCGSRPRIRDGSPTLSHGLTKVPFVD